jgi:hypothetical protein
MVYGCFIFFADVTFRVQFFAVSGKITAQKPDTLCVHARAPATPCFFINT